MAATQSGGDDEIITGINVTPLVDVVLVLLVILMVTAGFIASQTIPLDLPKGSTGEAVTTTLSVTLDGSGTLYLDGVKVSRAELRDQARAAKQGDPRCRAILAAPGDADHRSVVQVIDTLRQAGVFRYAIQVQPEDLAI